MVIGRRCGAGLLLSLLLGGFGGLEAQAAAPVLPTWHPSPPSAGVGNHLRAWGAVPGVPLTGSARTRSHTKTGLLVGGLVGAAATAVFLSQFCSDPDTECGAGEVGRAALVFVLPAAALGALIGSLIRTEER